MDKQTLKSFKELLLKERKRLAVDARRADKKLQTLGENRPIESEEKASVEIIMDVLTKLRDQGNKELKDIEGALRKIETGAYGMCEECGKHITEARLKALPTAHLCIHCKEKKEKREKIDFIPEEVHASKKASLGEHTNLPDEELTEIILEQLEEDGRVETNNIEVLVQAGRVFLSGTVSSEADRQIILQQINDNLGISDVEDNIEVTESIYILDEANSKPIADIEMDEELEEIDDEEDLELE
jgi:DnaK suppressor protein